MKRILTFFVVLLVMLTMMPVTGMAASKATEPAYLNEAQVKQRMDDLLKCLNGKYFTVNGTYCKKPGKSGHGCDNCSLRNVIKSSKFKEDVNGKVPADTQISGTFTHYYGNKTVIRGKSCAGFANNALWYIFASANTDTVKVKNITKEVVKFNYDNMISKARPGDIIRLGGTDSKKGTHSAIVYSINKKSVTVIDCNQPYKTKGNCYIYKHDFSYSSFKRVGITRAANYAPYTVYYNANGGKGAPSPQAKLKNTELKLSTDIPSRSGYTFIGWATSNKATVAEYFAGGKYTKNATVTMYAVWQKDVTTYTISFDANGGSGAPAPQTKAKNADIKLSATIPTRSSYIFTGWATTTNATVAEYQPGNVITTNADLILYAIWAPEGGYNIQYRYKDTLTTTKTDTKTLSGWTLSNTVSATTDWIDNGKAKIEAVNTDALVREVKTTEVAATYQTQYRYMAYVGQLNADGAKYTGKSKGTNWRHFSETWAKKYMSSYSAKYTPWLNDALKQGSSAGSYSGSGTYYRFSYNGQTYYAKSPSQYTQKVLKSTAYTTYKYRDTTYTYYFAKETEWSEWSSVKPEEKEGRTIERRVIEN